MGDELTPAGGADPTGGQAEPEVWRGDQGREDETEQDTQGQGWAWTRQNSSGPLSPGAERCGDSL